MKAIRPAAILALLLFAAAAARADDAADAKAEAASRIETAKPLLARGGYFDAVSNLKKAVAADPTNVEAAMLLAGALRDTGENAKAIDALSTFDKSAAALTLRAELLLVVGKEAEAEASAKKAFDLDPLALGALVVVGRVQELSGKRGEAIATYEDVNHRWVKTTDEQETGDMLLADARARLGLFRLSNDFAKDLDGVVARFEAIIKRYPDRLDAFVECGDFYLSAYRDIEAKKWYVRALDRNPHFAPALFGKARQMAFRYEEVDAAKVCENEVLRENPSYVPAMLFLAQQALGDGDLDKGEGLVKRALAVNPTAPETRAAHAALLYLRGDRAGFDAEAAAVLARDKFAAEAYATLGHVLEQQRQFDEALVFGERAVAVDPLDWDAYFLAGRNALNVGDDAKGEKYLKAAEKDDPFPNIYRANFLKLFNQMRNFTLRKDAKFVLRMPPDEEEAYYRLLRLRMEASIDLLADKWKFKPAMPTFVSEFARQEDFATRTIGLPGFPALGACFGQVVTLDSPRALPPGVFLWSLCEHHELAHVITLQLSKGRIPRWLTEGISVYEERKASKTWWREYERDVIDAIASDDVLTLKDIDHAFRGARVMYAYYQGGLMCELIERDFGFDKLREMVRLYGEGLATDAVVRKALSIEPEEFDRRFLAFASDYVKDLHVLPRPTKEKVDKLKRALRKAPDDAEAWFLVCEGCIAQGDNPAALSALANAAKILPDDGRVPAMRALIAWREQRPDVAVEHAQEAIAKGFDLYELRMGLATYYAQPGKDAQKAKENWGRAIELFPLQDGPGDPRLLLAASLTAEGEKNIDEVMKLMRAHVDVDENDLKTRKALATIYAQQSRPDDELTMREQMRDIAPLPNMQWTRADAVELHSRLGEMYGERKRYAEAELAWACAVGVARMRLSAHDAAQEGGPAPPPIIGKDLADLLVSHAASLHLVGSDDAARARLDEALREDPENDAAKALKNELAR